MSKAKSARAEIKQLKKEEKLAKKNAKKNMQYVAQEKEKSPFAIDYSLLLVIVILTLFGLVMLYSTSYYNAEQRFGDDKYFLIRQIINTVVGFVFMAIVAFIISKTDILKLKIVPWGLWIISLFLMALVRTPLGVEAYGARRWISIPGLGTMQPSESAKIAIILLVAMYLVQIGDGVNTWKGFSRTMLIGIFTSIYIFYVTNHLSAAVIVFSITYFMVIVIHEKGGLIGIVTAGLGLIGYFGIRVWGESLEAHGSFRLSRILVWLHPENHTDTGGFQILQGLYAIGSGGFFGKGFGNSSQKLGFIPEVQNDMILAIICEELGVLGMIVVMTLFGYLLYRIIFIARNIHDTYYSLIMSGIFAHIALQVILNILVIVNLIPTTGITLPFISYGGSSIVFLLIEMGIAIGISARIKRQSIKEEAELEDNTSFGEDFEL